MSTVATIKRRAAAAGKPTEPRQQRAALAVAMLGFAVVTLDAQIVNVALPSIHNALGGGLSGLQWIVTAYTLMFSSLLLLGGTIAGRIGSRSAYRNGMLLFVAASVVCAFAPSLPLLVVARLFQGTGAALVTPTALSLIREAYDESKSRARAIAYWGVGGSIAAAAGPILGGILTQIDWRLIFLINVPVGATALLILKATAQSPRRHASFDWAGQITAIVGLASLTYAFIEGGSQGFSNPAIIAAFALAIAALGAFLRIEARRREPMVPLPLFRSRRIAISLSIAGITMLGFYGTVFLQSLYFQEQRGYSALATGLLFLPMTGLVALSSAAVAQLMNRFSRRAMIVAGQVGMATGLLTLALVPHDAPIWIPSCLMIGVGVGGAVTVPPIAALIFDAAPADLAGTASGVLNTVRQLGGSLGVAIFGAAVNASSHFITGLRISYVGTAVLLSATVMLTLSLRGTRS
jgi:MFS transporter, DHA2 family, methylenomycin A resistance protein